MSNRETVEAIAQILRGARKLAAIERRSSRSNATTAPSVAMELRIDSTGLSHRVKTILLCAGITKVGQLAGMNSDGLLELRNMSGVGLTEIRNMLRSFGFCLANECPHCSGTGLT